MPSGNKHYAPCREKRESFGDHNYTFSTDYHLRSLFIAGSGVEPVSDTITDPFRQEIIISSRRDWHLAISTLSTPHNSHNHSRFKGQRLYPATDQHGQLQHASTKAATDSPPGIQFSSFFVWGWRPHTHGPSSISPPPEQIQSVCPMDCKSPDIRM